MLPTAYILPAHLRHIRNIARHRLILTGIQTSVKNRIHAILRHFNLISPYKDLFSIKGCDWLFDNLEYLSKNYKLAVKNYLSLIDLLERQIHLTNCQIYAEISDSPQITTQIQLLQEIPGIYRFSHFDTFRNR